MKLQKTIMLATRYNTFSVGSRSQNKSPKGKGYGCLSMVYHKDADHSLPGPELWRIQMESPQRRQTYLCRRHNSRTERAYATRTFSGHNGDSIWLYDRPPPVCSSARDTAIRNGNAEANTDGETTDYLVDDGKWRPDPLEQSDKRFDQLDPSLKEIGCMGSWDVMGPREKQTDDAVYYAFRHREGKAICLCKQWFQQDRKRCRKCSSLIPRWVSRLSTETSLYAGGMYHLMYVPHDGTPVSNRQQVRASQVHGIIMTNGFSESPPGHARAPNV